ncbi:MAG: glycoside hydrolase family 43 protein [Bacteroidaceae bacterium]|nr:glycoside hydrolase family 43 protein [Bacteroidaceae bacterium]MBR1789865.1 glycoside hydrolase family 43 protein [Bacteroidaceae bacterium]
MKGTGWLFVLLFVLTGCASKPVEYVSTISNPMPIKMGDPFMLHASDGRYYMYGTSLEDGFEAMVSDDLINWESCGQIYHGGDSSQWNVSMFWAPEVYERNGKYYLFYSANWRHNPTNEAENFRIGVAVSDSPAGPFHDLMNRPLFDPGYPAIDANVYFDDESGRCFLYFSRCCYKHPVESEIAEQVRQEGLFSEVEESWVYGVELKSDFSGIIGEPQLLLMPPKELDDVQAEWESRSVTSGEVNRRWTEGSFVFRHDDTYYIMYSANSYTGSHYAVGYATSKSPMGPFQKAINNPVLQENVTAGGTVMGTGHNMVIRMPDGELYTVYHGRMSNNPNERVVLMDHIRITPDGTLTIYGPTVTPQQIVVKTE